MNTADSDGAWYLPMQALDVLEPRYGAGTKTLIADKLRDGRIRARADRVWDTFESSQYVAWRKREEGLANPDAQVACDVDVETTIWEQSRFWNSDIETWRWPAGRFVITRRKSPPDRTIIEGLRLFKKDIDDLNKPPSKRGGKKPNYPGYANLFCAVLELERAKKLTRTEFPSKKSLETTILETMASVQVSYGNLLDEETTKQIVNAIWDRVVAHEGITME